MRALSRLPALLGLALLAASDASDAGGYMRSGEEAELALTLKMDFGDRLFDKSGTRRGGGCSAGVSASFYGEYGLSYYTTLFANASLRHKDCAGRAAFSPGDTEIGLRRRVDPLRNDWVWEASLIIPTSRLGDPQPSDAQSYGLDLGLHWRPRPDPYDLSRERDDLEATWDLGAGVRAWSRHLPSEAWAYAAYRRPLRVPDFRQNLPGLAFVAELDGRASLARAHATRSDAVDVHDRFRLLGLDLGLSYKPSPFEILRATLRADLAGSNRADSSGIYLTYGRTLPR